MKIALVCPYDLSYPGGVQNHVLQFAQYAKEAGHAVTVIAPNSKKIGYDGTFSAGKSVPIPLGIGTVARLTLSFWNAGKLRELLENSEFDIVHVHEPGVPILGPLAIKYARSDSSALVSTSHSNITPNLVTWAYSTFCRAIGVEKWMGKVDVRTAVSPAAAKLAKHYLPGDYLIIPNGIDTGCFSPDVKPIEKYMDGKSINMLFVGRLGNNERRKGLYYAVSAFNEIHWKHPNTRLLIVGPGDLDQRTRGLINSTGNNGVTLVGQAPFAELPRYYQTAHIFVAPPTDGESFSLVVAEAMASGKPVVTTNIPGPRDVLLGFSNYGSEVTSSRFFVAEAGILVKPRDIETTAEQLEWLVLHEEARRRMGNAGRKIVVENFSWGVVAPRILALYERVIAAKQQRK